MESDWFGISIAPMNDYSDLFVQRLLAASHNPCLILYSTPRDVPSNNEMYRAIAAMNQRCQAVDYFGIPVRSRNSYSARTFARLEVLSGQVRLKALSRTLKG
jgi:hypothetical protein